MRTHCSCEKVIWRLKHHSNPLPCFSERFLQESPFRAMNQISLNTVNTLWKEAVRFRGLLYLFLCTQKSLLTVMKKLECGVLHWVLLELHTCFPSALVSEGIKHVSEDSGGKIRICFRIILFSAHSERAGISGGRSCSFAEGGCWCMRSSPVAFFWAQQKLNRADSICCPVYVQTKLLLPTFYRLLP